MTDHALAEVHVEQGELDDGVVMIFRPFGQRVRMMFDRRRIDEPTALSLLRLVVPRFTDAVPVKKRDAA